jgi:hypothetical protein
MRKHGILLILVMTIIMSGLGAQESALVRGHYQPGNMQFGVDAGAQINGISGLSLAAYPMAEFIFAKVRPLDLFAIDIGAQAFARLGLGLGSDAEGFGIGAGAMATFHFGLNGLSAPGMEVFRPLDFVTSLGLGYDISGARLAFAVESGFQYFINPGLAVRLMYRNFGQSSDVTVGVVIKLGKAEEGEVHDITADVRTVEESITQIEGNVIMLQFTALNAMSLGYWGYSWVGLEGSRDDGSVWRIRNDDGDEFLISRAVLAETAEGVWNQLVFEGDGERIVYEYLVDPYYRIVELRYRLPDGDTGTYYPEAGEYQAPEQLVTDAAENFGLEYLGEEQVRVPAGNFTADHYRTAENGASYDFWLSEQVPGAMVKYEFTSDDGSGSGMVTGELFEIIINARAELGDYR